MYCHVLKPAERAEAYYEKDLSKGKVCESEFFFEGGAARLYALLFRAELCGRVCVITVCNRNYLFSPP